MSVHLLIAFQQKLDAADLEGFLKEEEICGPANLPCAMVHMKREVFMDDC